MRINSILIILLITTVYGCNFEREVSLGDNYFLCGDGANTSISKKVPDKVGVYDDIVIGEIVSYSFDDNYIVIYRDVSEESKVFFHEHDLWTEKNNLPKYQFWVINKSSDEVFGPLNFFEYLELKKKEKIKISIKV